MFMQEKRRKKQPTEITKDGQGCGPGLCHCPLLSDESASGSLTCPLSVLQSPVFEILCLGCQYFQDILVFWLV